MTEKRKTGTAEWAEVNLNIAQGCSHGCRYCYARHNAVTRFKRVEADSWPTEVVDQARVTKRYGLREGKTIMFPTAHDITPAILDDCVTVLKKVLAAGNQVLIVTKPHLECVQRLCADLEEWQDQVLFRFTIGATDDEVLSFWEPNAPTFEERMDSLAFARTRRWATSVSIEPMLDPKNIDVLVLAVQQWVTETIWIGKMNHIRMRCPDVDDATVTALEAEITDEKILAMVDRFEANPLIDSKKVRTQSSSSSRRQRSRDRRTHPGQVHEEARSR